MLCSTVNSGNIRRIEFSLGLHCQMATKPLNPNMTLNARQEAFCRGLAEGKSQSAAYLDAGYDVQRSKTADEAASRLSRNVKVVARVAELQRQNALASQVTVASVTEMYLAVYRGAMAEKDYPPATAPATGIAKLHGMIVEKQELRRGRQQADARP